MRLINGEYSKHGGWFRVFGYGLSATNFPPLFSERNGYRVPVARFGQWRVFTLKPVKP